MEPIFNDIDVIAKYERFLTCQRISCFRYSFECQILLWMASFSQGLKDMEVFVQQFAENL